MRMTQFARKQRATIISGIAAFQMIVVLLQLMCPRKQKNASPALSRAVILVTGIGDRFVGSSSESMLRHSVPIHAVAVNSGTSALHAAVVAAVIGPGHEVIVPAAAYVSAASVVVQERAIPVMCDIDETTYCISSEDVEHRLSEKTRAIIPVHFWGCPVDMARITKIARHHNLIVIEDCAQSHGSTIGRQMTGSIGDFGCFSFAPRKHITTGQGGMVLCKSERHALRVRELVNFMVRIPGGRKGVESLNAGVATAVALAEFFRKPKCS
jgi:glycine/serine hydroxymethyltransferase